MKIIANSPNVIVSGVVRIQAIEGVAPYTYSIVEDDGDGGSIDQNGFFYAPKTNVEGYQKIRVVDDEGEEIFFDIPILNHLQMVCHIIRTHMSLKDDQVYMYSQKFKIPKDDRLYITVGQSGVKFISSNSKLSQDGEKEVLSTNCSASLSINIMSRGQEALNRKEEVISALKSHYSQRVQTACGFKLAEIPANCNDISEVEASAIPFRFNISLNMLYFISETKETLFFDDFQPVQILTEE